MSVTIYHYAGCGTSRNTLALIRAAGIEPTIVLYREQPPGRAELAGLIARAGLTVRQAVREKEALFKELGLDDLAVSDEALLDAMVAHPVLINRPFVVTARGVRLCRPAELVGELLDGAPGN
jgi:arsenate reductase